MKPYPYQELTLNKIANRSRVALFWQMRLGKSPMIIWWHQRKKIPPERNLIICPKSVINSWIEELQKHDLPYYVLSTQNKELHDAMLIPGYFITNYECLIAKDINIHDQPWDSVTLDESVKIQNPKAISAIRITDSKSFPLNSEKYPHWKSRRSKQLRAILCGTPAPESELQYFNQFKFLYGRMDKFNTFYHYRRSWFETSWEKPGKYIIQSWALPKLAKYVDKYAEELSRKQIGMDLPNVYEKEFVEMDPKHKKVYDDFEKNWFTDFMNHLLQELPHSNQSIKQLETRFATVAQNYLHQLACGYPKQATHIEFPHKMNELNNLITGELKGEKLVIWCHYRRDIEAIRRYLKATCAYLWGSMRLEDERHSLARFRNQTTNSKSSSSAQVLICQIAKASMGMDLSAADTQVFFSRSWSALSNQQATDRLIHPDKIKSKEKQALLTVDLITKDTIDEDLHHALIEKKANATVWKLFLERTKFDTSKLHLETADI